MSDLIERLRAVVNAGPDFLGNDEGRCVTCSYRNPDGPEAAEELERLYARVAEMQRALVGICAMLAGYAGQPNHMGDIYKIADAALTNSGAPDDEG